MAEASGSGARRVSVARVVAAAALFVLGVVLWIMTGAPAYGLVSGLGVVLGYSAAEPWLERSEGVIAKRQDAPYKPGERVGMVKVKRVRTIDAVVIGWRPGKEEGTVGSLILALYDDGELRPVGHTSGFSAKQKRELPAALAPYETGERGHGDPSRWANERELEWVALRPELVVEVTFDHTSNDRIRYGTTLKRWRDDKAPTDCKMEQLQS